MRLSSKVIRAGDESRKTRFHTLRGELIPKRELITVPMEFLLRLCGRERTGPWISKSAVRELSRLLNDGTHRRILEIGGGRSTSFFSQRASFLMTIEENSEWALKIKRQIDKGEKEFQLVNIDLTDWLNTRTKSNMDFDVVLIDGGTDVARKMALEMLPSLNSRAIYILDNSDRSIFGELKFSSQPKKIVRYSGLIRNPFQATETSFYYF